MKSTKLNSPKTARTSVTLQNASFTYDALNRLATVTDKDAGGVTRITVANDYDANGNVMKVASVYPDLTHGSGTLTPVHYYRYDSMNRMVVAGGSVVGGTIVRGASGLDIAYDLAGRRVSVTRDTGLTGQAWTWIWYEGHGPGSPYWPEIETSGINGDMGYADANYMGSQREEYSYRADGELSEVRFAQTGYTDNNDGTLSDTGVFGASVLRAKYDRDAAGRVTRYREYLTGGSLSRDHYNIVYDAGNRVTLEEVSQLKVESGIGNTYRTVTTNTYTNGRLTSTADDTYKNGNDAAIADTATSYSYGWWSDAVLTSTTHTPDVTVPGTTFVSTYYYDPHGRLASVDINDGRRRTVSFALTAEGQVLRRDEQSAAVTNPRDERLFLGTLQVGFLTNNGLGDAADQSYVSALGQRNLSWGAGQFRWGYATGVTQGVFGLGGYDPVNPATTGGTAQRYTVRGGDTLAAIAAAMWGDASLWYLLAEANGMTAGTALVEGQSLVIPNRVTNARNSAAAFRPYDPNRALGDLSPTTPQPQQAQKKGCGIIGAVMVMLVAVAITMLIKAPVIKFATSLFTKLGFGAGAAAFAGGVVGGAAVGAIANAGSQLFGMATGIQQGGFNWKAVATSAIAGGVSGGLNAAAFKHTVDGVTRSVSIFTKLGIGGAGWVAQAARAGISTAASEGIGDALGVSQFDFAGVAASAVGAGLTGGFQLGGVANIVADGLASAATRSVLTGTSFGDNIIAVLPGVIARSIGGYVEDRIAAKKAQRLFDEIGNMNAGLAAVDPGIITNGRFASIVLNIPQPGEITVTTASRGVGLPIATSQDQERVDNLAAAYKVLPHSERVALYRGPIGSTTSDSSNISTAVTIHNGKPVKTGGGLQWSAIIIQASDYDFAQMSNDPVGFVVTQFSGVDSYGGNDNISPEAISNLTSTLIAENRIGGTRSLLVAGELQKHTGRFPQLAGVAETLIVRDRNLNALATSKVDVPIAKFLGTVAGSAGGLSFILRGGAGALMTSASGTEGSITMSALSRAVLPVGLLSAGGLYLARPNQDRFPTGDTTVPSSSPVPEPEPEPEPTPKLIPLPPPPPTETVHGNSNDSPRPTEVYYLVNIKSQAIDKIGITDNPNGRYSAAYLAREGVRYVTVQRYETRYPALVHENIELVHYYRQHGKLPRLNKTFR